jgi:hypothetical protein
MMPTINAASMPSRSMMRKGTSIRHRVEVDRKLICNIMILIAKQEILAITEQWLNGGDEQPAPL